MRRTEPDNRTLTVCAIICCLHCSAEPGRERDTRGVAPSPAPAPAAPTAGSNANIDPISGAAGSGFVVPVSMPVRDADAGEDGECAGVSARAHVKLLPTDVIWAIDTSGSMALSFPAIQAALDQFSRKVIEAGVDAHIVLLAGATGGALSTTGMCVPAPLGSGRCGAGTSAGAPAADTNEPAFLHLDTPFAANEGVGVLLQHHAGFKHMLRPDARTQFVLTEDGAPPITAQAVVDHVEGRSAAIGAAPWMPGLSPDSWVFNGVVCPNGFALGSCLLASGVPASTLALIERTRGVFANLNDAGAPGVDPFAALLDALATNVIATARVECSYQIPAPPAGMLFDPTAVNVIYTSARGAETFPRAPDGSACSRHVAWRYDDARAPVRVELCPAACERVQADPAARIDVSFGCETMLLTPQ